MNTREKNEFGAIVITLLMVILGASLFFVEGCSTRIMSEESAQQVEMAAHIASEQKIEAQKRADSYKAKAEAPDTTPEAKVAWVTAYNEAMASCDLSGFLASQINEGMGNSVSTDKFIPKVALPALQAAANSTPWGALITTVIGAVVTVAGGLKAKERFIDQPADYKAAVERVKWNQGTPGEPPDMNDPEDMAAIRSEMPSKSRKYFDAKHPAHA